MNTDTDIELLLRADAHRWQEELNVGDRNSAAAGEVGAAVYLDPAHQPKSDSNRRRVLAAAIGIAAVVAVATVGLSLSRASHDTRTSPATATASADPLTPPSNGYLFPGIPPSAATTARPNSISGRVSMPWELSGISADAETITIYYAIGDGYCTTAAGIVVQQTNSYVSIQPVSTDQAHPTCPSVIRTGLVEVKLDAPLGTRKLLHPPVSEKWQNALR